MPIYALGHQVPRIHPDAYVHPDAVVIGDVAIGAESAVWPTAVLRADFGRIAVRERTSIQDGTVLRTLATPNATGGSCAGSTWRRPWRLAASALPETGHERRSQPRHWQCCAALDSPTTSSTSTRTLGRSRSRWGDRARPSAGMTGARLALTTAITMADEGREYGVATMCIGVVQGIATLFPRP
jgi:hypothetical protein